MDHAEELRCACRDLDIDAIDALVRTGVDVEFELRGEKPIDSVFWAMVHAGHGHSWGPNYPTPEIIARVVNIVTLLREAGATPGEFMNPLGLVHHRAPLEFVDAVLRIFPECDASNVLFNAVMHGYGPEMVRCLVGHGAELEEEYVAVLTRPWDCCLYPQTCLHVAVGRRDEDMVRLLLDLGACPYQKDNCGRDAAFWHAYRAPEKTKSIIADLFECKRAFDVVKHDLHRELVEYLSHPVRLQRLGYFRLLNCCESVWRTPSDTRCRSSRRSAQTSSESSRSSDPVQLARPANTMRRRLRWSRSP